MAYKANFSIKKNEVSVFFELERGSTKNKCFFCRSGGAETVNVVVSEVHSDSVPEAKDSTLFKSAKRKLKRMTGSGRAVHYGKDCYGTWLAAWDEHPGLEIRNLSTG